MRVVSDPRRAVDALIAVALTLTSQLEIWAPASMPGVDDSVDRPVMLSATTLAITVPLAFRRTAPLPVLLAGLGASALQQALGTPNDGLSTLVALLISSYAVSAYAAPAAVASAGVAIVLASAVIGGDPGDKIFVAIILGAAWLAGLIVGKRSGEVARLTDDNRDLAQRLAEAADLLGEARRREASAVGGPAPDELAALTARELDVVRAIATGRSNAEIAEHLVISEWTVKTHVASILRKLGLRDRAQVVVVAYESGLVEAGRSEPG